MADVKIIAKEEIIDSTPSASYSGAVDEMTNKILKDFNNFLLLCLNKKPYIIDDFDGAVVFRNHRNEEFKTARNVVTVACERAIKELINAGYIAKYQVKRAEMHDCVMLEDVITVWWREGNEVYNMI